MANSLVDFVVSLVRDPAAAAAYAADPAQALADAHLTDVSAADVQNLLPVVTESLSMTAPAHSWDAPGADPGHEVVTNVWSSGAATAAFDAFDDHVPDHVPSVMPLDTAHSVPAIVDHIDEPLDLMSASDVPNAAPSVQLDDPGADHLALPEPLDHEHWTPAVDDVHPIDHLPDLDMFH
ncbi:hypothetical protein FK535_26155 [Mycolicibacterium sp. 018/SC-01/001]|uniref:Rv0340 family IniB-related protein n=1 Tax=Mycolicibacterium sp. 018/SC-01/001 TaxID=2592069 RepID=UPI00117EBC52|nr:IniB N-terminal domain-containing protein [Mycolicibacterium sp. 018/SC-01/001]TRW77877.1 hypothetical protein FK535_26155 [Mycolicibacterium sp. 018/SC-01/001]